MVTYHSELIRWNKKINLTGLRGEREIMIKLFLDALTPLSHLNPAPGARWIDVGTGAGFPGLVLKIGRPDLKMVLVEATGKKISFLHQMIGLLRLEGVLVVHERIEHLRGPDWERRFNLLISRALNPAIVLKYAPRFLRPDGKVLLFQGRPDTLHLKTLLEKEPSLTFEKTVPISLPFADLPRSLLLLRLDPRPSQGCE
ncbi:MAG: 16S rRNA (guanine(527)-N(7))-methyltransferase RsmG [Candidatus Manganitrophaceae bacterium]